MPTDDAYHLTDACSRPAGSTLRETLTIARCNALFQAIVVDNLTTLKYESIAISTLYI